jgi:5'-nucleotidase
LRRTSFRGKVAAPFNLFRRARIIAPRSATGIDLRPWKMNSIALQASSEAARSGSGRGEVVDWDTIDTVLLDMDGTILDLRFDNFFWGELVPEHYASLHDLEIAEARARLVPRFAAVQGQLQWYCTDYWSRELGLDIAQLKYAAREHIGFLPGAEQFLRSVRASGKRLVLLTNAHHDSLRVKSEQTGLANLFDVTLSSHSFGHPKEHDGFWQGVAALDHFAAQRSLFVDDSLPVLKSARRHGIAHLRAIRRPDSTLPAREITEFVCVDALADLLITA